MTNDFPEGRLELRLTDLTAMFGRSLISTTKGYCEILKLIFNEPGFSPIGDDDNELVLLLYETVVGHLILINMSIEALHNIYELVEHDFEHQIYKIVGYEYLNILQTEGERYVRSAITLCTLLQRRYSNRVLKLAGEEIDVFGGLTEVLNNHLKLLHVS